MYLKLTHLSESLFVLPLFIIALAFVGSVVGLYCQEWRILGTRSGSGWNVQFNFKYLYAFRYKALDLSGINSLSLDSVYRRSSRSSFRTARLNTLSAETALGDPVAVTHLIPYSVPAPIRDFIGLVNARLSDPSAGSFDEKLVFNPLKMGDAFLYLFGSFFAVIMLLTVFILASMAGGLFAPAFISVGAGQVEYRSRVFTGVKSVPFNAIAAFEVCSGSELKPGDAPAWMLKAAGGGEKLQQTLKARANKNYPPYLAMNLKDGSRVLFYGAAKAKEEAKARELAEELNQLIGAEKPQVKTQ